VPPWRVPLALDFGLVAIMSAAESEQFDKSEQHPRRVPLRVFARKQLLLRRSVLSVQWHLLFPRHRFSDERLKSAPAPYRSDFLERCEQMERDAKPAQRPVLRIKWQTPQVTIEAVMLAVRERGLQVLKEADTIERLSRCDAAARKQINSRIERLKLK
jgi:hypothetical protein